VGNGNLERNIKEREMAICRRKVTAANIKETQI
jgi:hypothetical protein